MIKTPAFFRVAAAAALAVALAPVAVRAALPLAAAAVPLVAGVELGIRNVSAPAGGTAQVQVAVTEPKPISTGDFGFDFGDFAGIALFSPGSDALGVAVAQGNFLTEGSGVRLTGQGFTPRTKVRFDETLLADVQYVDSQHIDVVLASPVRMHGLRIKAENPDGSRTRYYSYERTQRQGTSADPIL